MESVYGTTDSSYLRTWSPCFSGASAAAMGRFLVPNLGTKAGWFVYSVYIYIYIWLVVSTPLKNISQWEGLFPYIMENKNMFETTNQDIYIYIIIYTLVKNKILIILLLFPYQSMSYMSINENLIQFSMLQTSIWEVNAEPSLNPWTCHRLR